MNAYMIGIRHLESENRLAQQLHREDQAERFDSLYYGINTSVDEILTLDY